MGLGDSFLLLGVRDDAIRIVGACDIFVLASLWEGLPLAVMEAMALGVPVVATNVGGLRELVRDRVAGTLVPPRNERALAEAIAELATDPERRSAMGRAAAEDAARFDNGRAVAAIEAMYGRMVNGRSKGPARVRREA